LSTPIFEQNATSQQRDGTQASFKTTKDIFQNELHNYTITNAIEDNNVYYPVQGEKKHRRYLRLGNFHPLFVFVLATL
jgi:type I restriction enzyme R subunit